MATIGYATLQVIPSLRGMEGVLKRELGGLAPAGQQAGDAAGKGFAGRFGSAVGGIARSVGQTLVSGLTAATAAGGALVAASLFKGWDRLTTIQDATSALTISLGDAGKAAKLLDEVLGVVRGTPFNLDQFAAAAQQLVGFGVEAGKVPHYLTAIGEAAATQGKRSGQFAEQLSTVFGQMAASGQVSLADVWRISDAGVNALAILANHFGLSRDAMKDMISKGAVPAGEALDALAKGILEGSSGVAGTTVALAGTMAGLRDTLSGAFGGFGAAMARFGASILTPFTGPLTKGLTGFAELLDKLGEKAKAWGEKLVASRGFQKFADWLADLPSKVGPLVSKLGDLGSVLAPIGAALAAMGTSGLASALGPLGMLLPTINPLVAAFVALVATTPELQLAFTDLVAAAAPLIAQLGEDLMVVVTELAKAAIPLLTVAVYTLVPILELLGRHAEVVSPALLSMLVAFKGFKVAKSLVGGLQSMATGIVNLGGAAKGAVTGFAAFTRSAALATAAAVRAAGAFVAMAVRSVVAFGLMAAAAVASAAAVVAAWLVAAAPFIAIGLVIAGVVAAIVIHWDTLKAATVAVWNAIAAFFSAVWQAIVAIVTGYVTTYVAVVTGAFNTVRTVVTTVLGTVRSVISTVLGTISSLWSRAWGAVTGIVSAALTGAYAAVSTGLRNVTGLVGELPTRIVNAVGNLGRILFNAGKAVIQGLIDGVRSMLGSLGRTLGGVGSFIADKKGPLDYDRRILFPGGQAIMQGLRRGIVSQMPGLASDLTRVTRQIEGLTASPTALAPISGQHAAAGGVVINLPNYLGNEREVARIMRAQFLKSQGHQPLGIRA